MKIKRNMTTAIVGALSATLLIGGIVAGCAPGSLALQPAATPTPASSGAVTTLPGAVPSGGAPIEGGATVGNGAAGAGVGAPGRVVPVPGVGAVARAPSAGAAVAASVAAPAVAVPPVPSPASALVHGIVVTGVGEVNARPDQAIVTAGVQSRAATAQDAQANTNRTMQAVIDALKGLGIPDKDIQTSGISLYPIQEQNDTISGYTASNSVTVIVEKVEQTGTVLDAAVKAGANMAGGVHFTFKDETGLRNKALAAAAVDARSKADALAGQLGLKISGIDSVAEGSVNVPRPFIGVQPLSAAAGAAPSVPVEPGEQTVTAQVTIVFGY